jgi:hypothetical protein
VLATERRETPPRLASQAFGIHVCHAHLNERGRHLLTVETGQLKCGAAERLIGAERVDDAVTRGDRAIDVRLIEVRDQHEPLTWQ